MPGPISGTDLSAYAPLASPTFTGTPTLPTGTIATTQSAGNSTTAVATTAFADKADNLKANLVSPTFSGTLTTPAIDITNGAWHWQASNFGIGGNWAGFSSEGTPSVTGYALLAHPTYAGTYLNAQATGVAEVGLRIANTTYYLQTATMSTHSTDVTIATAKNIIFSTGTGTKIGTGTTQKMGFYNATPIAQRSGAAQVAVATTASTQTTPYGYSTAAQADAIITLVNELRAWAVAQGFIAGA